MRHLLALAIVLLVGLAGTLPAAAFEVVTAPEDVNAVNLTSAVEIAPGTNGKIQLSTAPGEDGIIRRVEVLASQNGTNSLTYGRGACGVYNRLSELKAMGPFRDGY